MRLGEHLEPVLDSIEPDVVGITAYTVRVTVAKHLLKKVKKHNAKILPLQGDTTQLLSLKVSSLPL